MRGTDHMLNETVTVQEIPKLHRLWVRWTLEMEIYVTRDNHWVDVSQKPIKGGGELREEFRRDWDRAVDRYDDARRLT